MQAYKGASGSLQRVERRWHCCRPWTPLKGEFWHLSADLCVSRAASTSSKNAEAGIQGKPWVLLIHKRQSNFADWNWNTYIFSHIFGWLFNIVLPRARQFLGAIDGPFYVRFRFRCVEFAPLECCARIAHLKILAGARQTF